jgi:UDP-N-acetylmuramyl pentapeptide phosphotransferase/UDP-N-acetylglucosamine-1-phosphate transferase
MGLGKLGAALVAAAATNALERAAAKLPKENREPFERTNHRGEAVTLLEGPVAVLGALAGVAAAPSTSGRVKAAALLAGSVSGAVGAYDDLAGATQTKGFRGHLGALRRGEVTSGAVKILGVGAAGLAAAALLPRRSKGFGAVVEIVADGALIAGTANLTNLMDLRPGRAVKAVTALSAPVALVSGPAAAVVGAAAASAPSDLNERSMLGDCGANGLGAITGTALAASLPRPLKVLALGAVVALNLASEKVSFTKVIAETPVLDKIDQWGRRPR